MEIILNTPQSITTEIRSTYSGVHSVNGKTGDVVLDAEDVHALPDTTVVPTKTSDLINDSGFIDNTYHDPTKYDASNPSGYITQSYHDPSKYDASNPAGYVTSAYHDATKYDVSNPAGYINSAALNDYATKTYVQTYVEGNPTQNGPVLMAAATPNEELLTTLRIGNTTYTTVKKSYVTVNTYESITGAINTIYITVDGTTETYDLPVGKSSHTFGPYNQGLDCSVYVLGFNYNYSDVASFTIEKDSYDVTVWPKHSSSPTYNDLEYIGFGSYPSSANDTYISTNKKAKDVTVLEVTFSAKSSNDDMNVGSHGLIGTDTFGIKIVNNKLYMGVGTLVEVPNFTPTVNVKYWVRLVYDSGNWTGYIDGIQVATGTGTTTDSSYMMIGKVGSIPSYANIYEVRIMDSNDNTYYPSVYGTTPGLFTGSGAAYSFLQNNGSGILIPGPAIPFPIIV